MFIANIDNKHFCSKKKMTKKIRQRDDFPLKRGFICQFGSGEVSFQKKKKRDSHHTRLQIRGPVQNIETEHYDQTKGQEY